MFKRGSLDGKAGILIQLFTKFNDGERSYENLNGYQKHGDNLIYGVIKHGDDRIVEIGGNRTIYWT